MLNSLTLPLPFGVTDAAAPRAVRDSASARKPLAERPAPHRELEALIERMAVGDEDALAAFYDRTRGYVFGLVLRVVGDAAAAEEVVLDVYMQVWRKAGSFDAGRGGAFAWLSTIARSRAIDRLRAGKSQRHWELDMGDTHYSGPATNAEEDAAAAELRDAVWTALGELPPRQREVIELAYYNGLSHSEIGARLGLPLGTVKTRIRTGIGTLRERLGRMSGLL